MDGPATKILIADDDPFVRDMLTSILESGGYGVVAAENGQQALEICAADPAIDLIVSDVNMPEMDGIQLIRELRRKNLEVPIIMVTGVSSISVAVDALSSGAIDYVLKDEGIEETINITVKRALAKHQLKLQNLQLVADLAAKTAEQENTLSYLIAIISNMPDGLLVTNGHKRVTLANPALGSMFGVQETELAGKGCRDACHGRLAPLFDMLSSQSGPPLAVQIELEGGRTGSAVAAPILKKRVNRDAPDECIGNLVIVRDITSEKEIERMKDDFLSMVSHELRTPLTSVLGFTKVIRKKLDSVVFPGLAPNGPRTAATVQQIRDNIGIIISEGERLTALINDVLDLSKLEAGKIEWRLEPARVPDILEQAIAATASLFETKGIRLVRDIRRELPGIRCDRDRIIQVLINLLSNALKFTDSGSVTVAARKTPDSPQPAQIDRDFILISVIDTGIGIAGKDCNAVFEKFKQVGDTLTDRPKGTGLGLPICRQIVEYHEGRIWVDSSPGKGSTFSFTLPVPSGTDAAPAERPDGR